MAYVSGVCESCNQRRPVRQHHPLLKGMAWLCEECLRRLTAQQHPKKEVRK